MMNIAAPTSTDSLILCQALVHCFERAHTEFQSDWLRYFELQWCRSLPQALLWRACGAFPQVITLSQVHRRCLPVDDSKLVFLLSGKTPCICNRRCRRFRFRRSSNSDVILAILIFFILILKYHFLKQHNYMKKPVQTPQISVTIQKQARSLKMCTCICFNLSRMQLLHSLLVILCVKGADICYLWLVFRGVFLTC